MWKAGDLKEYAAQKCLLHDLLQGSPKERLDIQPEEVSHELH